MLAAKVHTIVLERAPAERDPARRERLMRFPLELRKASAPIAPFVDTFMRSGDGRWISHAPRGSTLPARARLRGRKRATTGRRGLEELLRAGHPRLGHRPRSQPRAAVSRGDPPADAPRAPRGPRRARRGARGARAGDRQLRTQRGDGRRSRHRGARHDRGRRIERARNGRRPDRAHVRRRRSPGGRSHRWSQRSRLVRAPRGAAAPRAGTAGLHRAHARVARAPREAGARSPAGPNRAGPRARGRAAAR